MSINTKKFYNELCNLHYDTKPYYHILNDINFNREIFTSLVKNNNTFVSISSSDGFASDVKLDVKKDRADHSRSTGFFGLHTDASYMEKIPEIVLMYCINPGVVKIPTVFADSGDIVKILQQENRLDEAKEYEFVLERRGQTTTRPIIETHPHTHNMVTNITIDSPECKLRPCLSSKKTQRDADEFYSFLKNIQKSKLNMVSHIWKKNDLIVFDNIQLLHGRGLVNQEEKSDNQRHLLRLWINRKF